MPVGTVVVPKASIAVTRNYDYDFLSGGSQEPPYRISKLVSLPSPYRQVLFRKQVRSVVFSECLEISVRSQLLAYGPTIESVGIGHDPEPSVLLEVEGMATGTLWWYYAPAGGCFTSSKRYRLPYPCAPAHCIALRQYPRFAFTSRLLLGKSA